MTDEVAALVLRDNYRQNRALDNAQGAGAGRWKTSTPGSCARSSSRSTSTARSNGFPTTRRSPTGATRGSDSTVPELAVLARVRQDHPRGGAPRTRPLPDDPDFVAELVRYFPTPLRERFAERIRAHPLAARDHRDRRS